ncbi:phosphatase domain-containing protein [Dongia deserti]|uniref:phosphatase domain-containing protein n=1 Tax=Dongia deserti TaxID=2268030 RepID=UPI000E64FB32|nr:dual specificity protein phosphatase family protein [Dongia deserti]
MDYTFNELKLPNGGRLGLGCCPGHRLRLSPLGLVRAPESLRDDLKAIAEWKPHAMLSLMEEHELTEAGAPVHLLAEALAEHSVEWLHLPICDMMAPDHRFETAWVDLWPRLDRRLQEGGRVFIHCYAGLGRTGTVASLILMQYGFSARDAIQQVRGARPGSIQSFEQEHYLSLMAHRARSAER